MAPVFAMPWRRRDFSGVTGRITIDEHRNARKSAVIIAVVDASFNTERQSALKSTVIS
jgi:hypothetical protein